MDARSPSKARTIAPASAPLSALPASLPPLGASSPLDPPARIGLALIVVAAVAIYAPRLGRPFFASDFALLEAARGHSLVAALASPDPSAGRQFYFDFLALACGGSPVAFHAVGLGLFVTLLLLLFILTRRLAGARAAVIAAAIVAVHYSAEVPMSWPSAAPEAAATALALAALLLHLDGRRWPAVMALVLAPFFRETAIAAPFVAAWAGRRTHEPPARALLRAWPLGVAVAPWVLVRLLAPGHGPGDAVPNLGAGTRSLLASLVHLPQVVAGFEWRQGTSLDLGRDLPGWTSVVLVVAAVFVTMRRSGEVARSPNAAAIATGIVWALLAALPAAAVASHWSAHHYLFATCGAALALGAWLARLTPIEAVVAVALLGLGSASARGLSESAEAATPWTGRSHVNRFSLDLASSQCQRYLESLRRARPSLPPRSTIFVDGVPPSVGFRTADGALIRRAYRDSTLRCQDPGEFSSARAARGAVLLFRAAGDSLAEVDSTETFRQLAISRLLAEDPERARAMLEFERERGSRAAPADYLLAWIHWERGERDSAVSGFDALGLRPADARAPDEASVVEALTAADTLRALETARTAVTLSTLDPGRHGLLADVLLLHDPDDRDAAVEAWVARALAPGSPVTWLRWGKIQIRNRRHTEALASLERCAALARTTGDPGAEAEAEAWAKRLRDALPGAPWNQREPAP